MVAMQSMIDASQTFNLDKSKIQFPEFDNELKRSREDEQNKKTELTVLSQDRNDWDDIFDEFQDISFKQLQSRIDSYKRDNSVAIYKEIAKLIKKAATSLSSNVLLESVLQMVYNHEKQELEKELLDFLGTGNIELVSLLLQHRRMIIAMPIETIIVLIENAAKSTSEFLTQQDIRNQVLQNAENAKNQKLNPADRIIKYPHVFRKYEVGSTSAMAFAGQKFTLPIGTTRTSYQTHEEIMIPAADQASNKNYLYTKLLKIEDLDHFCKTVFSYETLNQIQSLVYPVAYKTNENMLICAPHRCR